MSAAIRSKKAGESEWNGSGEPTSKLLEKWTVWLIKARSFGVRISICDIPNGILGVRRPWFPPDLIFRGFPWIADASFGTGSTDAEVRLSSQ